MEYLVLKNIVLKYYKDTALRVDRLEASAPFGVLGFGGAGKSSLLKAIAGLEEIESGEIFIKGNEVGGVRIGERNISLISAQTPLFERKSVVENLVYPLKKRGVKKAECAKAVEEIKDSLPPELKENLQGKIRDLSPKGKAALLFFRAIIKKPAIILVDEPCAFLENAFLENDSLNDSLEGVSSVTAYFLRLLRASGVFFIIASYDLKVLSLAADRFVVLRRGEIVFDGEKEEIMAAEDKYISAMARFF